MQKTYDPHAIETRWYPYWEEQGYFKPAGDGQSYCIMLPPPNVTGTLHMGHAFQHTLMDILIRYQRMHGANTHWQCGTDHAGIATQMVVERQLNAENKTRHELGRDAFVKRIWQWKAQSGDIISRQMRRLGDSPDWTQERFTMDEGLSVAVSEVFVRLHEEGLIYRGQRLVNWDPVLHTAVSDLEVVAQEEEGQLWHIRYPLADGTGYITIATTRPETLLGDSAVAIHPDDTRYQHLIGKQLQLPLCARTIPVIADDYVDPSFGSGCVKITPAHDFNDYAVGQRHHLPLLNIFTTDARINNDAPPAYRGLDRETARQRIIADLQQHGLLVKTEPHKMMVPRGDRSGAVIEPYLTYQWFVKTQPLAEPAIQAVEQGRIRFIPENWSKTYFNWMHNIDDWCISRQLWWGHRIPAWYDDDGNIYVGHTLADVRQRYGLPANLALRQDEDILDTWFSSALWPFSTLGWPHNTDKLKQFYPGNVLVTGFDIIFFWVARMIMMGLKFMQEVPFREVYITGLIRDEHGQKMSKSKGNILDPLDLMDGINLTGLIEKRTRGLMQPQMAIKIENATRKQYPDGIPGYGADALRFTLASLASTGRDIRFDIKRMEGYRNFCNKLWNAARYVLMQTQNQDCGIQGGNIEFSWADRWIQSQLQNLQADIIKQLENYRFDLAAQQLYEFIWNEYCDWYIELCKPLLQSDDSAALQHGARYSLLTVLESLLRLAHPFIPYITEEIWQQIAPLAGVKGNSIMQQPYPVAQLDKIDAQAVTTLDWIKAFVLAVRRIRAEMDIPPGKNLPLLLQGGSLQDRELSSAQYQYLCTLAKLSDIKWLPDNTEAPQAAIAVIGDMKILIPLAGLIDKDAELLRLQKEIDKQQTQQARLQQKLKNASFIEKAPAAIVQQEQQKLMDIDTQLKNLQVQHEKISHL